MKPGMSTRPDAVDAQTEAFTQLLAAVEALGEFWEARITGDQLDNVDLMDIVLNAAEHAAAGGDRPACGHSRVVSGQKVEARGGGGNYIVYGATIYKTSSSVCGRVAGHRGRHRGNNSRWTDDTPDWS